MPPEARLGDAPHLQAILDPAPRLDVTPRHVLQQEGTATRAERLRRLARPAAAAVAVHVGFAAAFVLLLSFRDPSPPHETETPVEVVALPPDPPKAAAAPGGTASSAGSGTGVPTSAATRALQQALAAPATATPGPPPVAPDPNPPRPPQVQPAAAPLPPPEPKPKPDLKPEREADPKREPAPDAKAAPAPRPPPGEAAVTGPKLVPAPPAPMPAAAQAKADKPANLVPDEHQADQATHEARPAEVPRVLTTSDAKAGFAVPAPLPPKPDPIDRPAPQVAAKVPSATDKLAAVLPTDLSMMPSSFRNVLSGNGAQVSAAYKGLVYGRFRSNPDIVDRAQRQHLRGQVIVAFSIDETGQLTGLSIVQSSGSAALDALGLEMIRSAAPFPPPPPEAQRNFTPALSFGE